MVEEENIEKIYDSWSPEEQKSFLQKCYSKLMSDGFDGTDDCVACLNTRHKNETKKEQSYIRLSGKALKDYGCFYLEHYATKDEKEKYKKYSDKLQTCYTVVISTKGDINQKHQQIQERNLNCTLPKLRYYAYKFCFLIKGIDKKDAKKLLSYKPMHRYDRTFEQLIILDEEEKIIDVIGELVKKEKSSINMLRGHIRTFIKFYKNSLSEEAKEALINQLTSKLEIYEKYSDNLKNTKKQEKKAIEKHQQIQKEQDYLPKARQIIEEFNIITTSIGDYCKLNNLPLETFKKSLSILQKHDPESYDRYLVALEEKEEKNFNNNKGIAEQLLVYLKEGIMQEDGTKRPFDLLDYYFMTTSTIEALSHCIEYKDSTFSKSDYLILRRFLSSSSHAELEPLDTKQLMDTSLEINTKKDENNLPIPGSGRIISNMEKLGIIQFLQNNNIPLTKKVYNLALNRYIAFSEEKTGANVKPKQMVKNSNPSNKN